MNELDKLRDMLTKAGVPYEDEIEPMTEQRLINPELANIWGEAGRKWWHNQVIYGRGEHEWLWDGICQYGSYGAEEGLIESLGQLGCDEDGYPKVVTAEEAFAVIKADYDKRNND